MSPKERTFKILEGEKVDRPSVLSVTQTGTVELMEASNAYWPDANFNAELMAKLAIVGHTIANLEGIRIPFCLTVLAESMGCIIDKGRIDRQPSIAKTLYDQGKTPNVENLLDSYRIHVVLDAIHKIKEMNFNVPLIVGFEGPTTLAGHLLGVERLCLMMIRKPEEVKSYIEKAEEACVIYAKELIKEGADIIVVADPTASPSVLSPKMFEKFSKEPLKSIAKLTKRSVLHICGNATPILNHMAECGFSGLSIEEKVDLKTAKSILKDKKVAIIGNVPSAGVLLNGTEEEVYNVAKQAIASGVDILAPSCGIAPHTPTRNIKAMVRAAIS
ncbi:MAG: MtaA/CmuA family methyltransferase [Candidatus Verstraetearchaeota archaeon]|jgi:[methyl-Co(III) methanol-specific corrinoid protein]:coenzyme M methyltransferase|nr:MtaA/CmuA family methyltransferase [Candidatus Verstraetearchaeota archaeon]